MRELIGLIIVSLLALAVVIATGVGAFVMMQNDNLLRPAAGKGDLLWLPDDLREGGR